MNRITFLSAIGLISAASPGQVRFVVLPPVSTGVNCGAAAISRDGSTIVGYSVVETAWASPRAVKWSAEGVVSEVAPMPLGWMTYESYSTAVSGDGSLVFGHRGEWVSAANSFLAMGEDGEVINLPRMFGTTYSRPYSASWDGSVVVGLASDLLSPGPVAWINGGEPFRPAGLPGVGSAVSLLGVSADGAVAVGSAGGTGGVDAVRWDRWVPLLLARAPGSRGGEAAAVSDDGGVIVGKCFVGSYDAVAVRWNGPGAAEVLAMPEGRRVSAAAGVSANGRVIVGGCGETTSGETQAVVWTGTRGRARLVVELLAEAGVRADGVRLTGAVGVSADGTRVVGTGRDSAGLEIAWVATLPGLARCAADADGSGGIDGADVEAFFVGWEAGEFEADFDESGGVDGADVGAFFVAWEAGVCE